MPVSSRSAKVFVGIGASLGSPTRSMCPPIWGLPIAPLACAVFAAVIALQLFDLFHESQNPHMM
ncbi:hypothetical protein ACVILL_004340 [Bradyrhizobium sp. USDA 3364]